MLAPMGKHDHDHDHDHAARSWRDGAARARARIPAGGKGLRRSQCDGSLIEDYETKVGPRNGAQVWPRRGATPAIASGFSRMQRGDQVAVGFEGSQGQTHVVLENTPRVHNMVVCTLCSCYPWRCWECLPSVKSAPYRARAVIDPRGVLAEFGVTLADAWKCALGFDRGDPLPGLPERPAGTEGWNEERCRVGDARFDDRHRQVKATGYGGGMNTVHDLGGMQNSGRWLPRRRADVPPRVGAQGFRHDGRDGGCTRSGISINPARAREHPPALYLSSSYYKLCSGLTGSWSRGD